VKALVERVGERDTGAGSVDSGEMRLTPQQCHERLAGQRHAVLATITPDGRPHAVPIVFALDGERLVTAVDAKPKSTRDLQRLRNLRQRPRAAVLAERYDEDWSLLWWVRVDTVARVIDAPTDVVRLGAGLLAQRYPQYGGTAPAGPLIVLQAVAWTGWSAG
jgi:PPOX class probable F420-dependent enzyme